MASLHFSSWFFLAFMTFVLPYGAIATARRTRSAAGPANIGSRSQLHLSATVTQVLIFGIAWYAALLQGRRFLGSVHLTACDLLAGVVTLARLRRRMLCRRTIDGAPAALEFPLPRPSHGVAHQ
ncbi:MAG: hypothetical protein ACRENQ_01970 [Gemmatimonadaceae bacterium]